jgi:ligand-binding sensor domain-containing protein
MIVMTFHTALFLGIVTVFAACTEQQSKSSGRTTEPAVANQIGDTVSGLGKNLGSLLQDKNGNYWVASNGDGVYRYDGKTIMHFTDKDGLCSNFVTTIQEDVNGHLWFTTRDGVCRFDGVSFTNFTTIIRTAMPGVLHYRSVVSSLVISMEFASSTVQPLPISQFTRTPTGPKRITCPARTASIAP